MRKIRHCYKKTTVHFISNEDTTQTLCGKPLQKDGTGPLWININNIHHAKDVDCEDCKKLAKQATT